MKKKTLAKWLLWSLASAFVGGFIYGYEGYETGLSTLFDLFGYTTVVPSVWLAVLALKDK